MKTIIVALVLVCSHSMAFAKDNNFRYEQPRSSYSTKTYPDYRAPLSSSSPTGQNTGKSCVVVNDKNYFTNQVTQVVKCY